MNAANVLGKFCGIVAAAIVWILAVITPIVYFGYNFIAGAFGWVLIPSYWHALVIILLFNLITITLRTKK